MKVFIPTPLRPFAGGHSSIEVDATTIGDALHRLTQSHGELRRHLFTEDGRLRAFVNLYLNDEDVRYLPQKEATAVSGSDTLSIIPSIAGGIAACGASIVLKGHDFSRADKASRLSGL